MVPSSVVMLTNFPSLANFPCGADFGRKTSRSAPTLPAKVFLIDSAEGLRAAPLRALAIGLRDLAFLEEETRFFADAFRAIEEVPEALRFLDGLAFSISRISGRAAS